jgi:hypothetical protein
VSTRAIRIEGLTKRYPRVTAVDEVSLQVRPGEIYALLGTVRPTAGTVSMLGAQVSPAANHLWARVGHLVETPAAYPELTTRENLDADRRARTPSLGNLQRLGLAKALIHACQRWSCAIRPPSTLPTGSPNCWSRPDARRPGWPWSRRGWRSASWVWSADRLLTSLTSNRASASSRGTPASRTPGR